MDIKISRVAKSLHFKLLSPLFVLAVVSIITDDSVVGDIFTICLIIYALGLIAYAMISLSNEVDSGGNNA